MHLLYWLADCKEHMGVFCACFHVLGACDYRHVLKPEDLNHCCSSGHQAIPSILARRKRKELQQFCSHLQPN